MLYTPVTSVVAVVTIVNTDLEAMGNFREIELLAVDLENCLDLVTELVGQGYTLCSVSIWYNQRHTIDLPVDLFDGQLFTPAIKQLQQEWVAIMAER